MSVLGPKSANVVLVFLTGVSFFGLILTGLLVVSPPVSRVDFAWRKPVVGSVFALICVLGSLAAVFPSECSGGFRSKRRERRGDWLHFSFKGSASASGDGSSVLLGHHPTCAVFSSHVFRLGGRVLCATCSGLFLGGVLSLVGAAVYFFGDWRVGQGAALVALVGVSGVAVGLLQSILIRVRWSSVRVFSGLTLAVGALLLLVVVDELSSDFFLDVFVVFLSLLWLVARVSLSRWEHDGMCSRCGSASCVLEAG